MLTRMPWLGRLLGIGWFFAFSIVGGVVGGLLVDGWLGTRPVFILIGLFAGLAVAFYGGLRLLMQVISTTGSQQGPNEEP